MDRCFLDLQPSSHWGRRNHLAWFPQPLLWPFGSEFCFRRASQIPTKITWWDGFQARTKTTKTSYSKPMTPRKMRSSGTSLFLSFLCSTVFINMIQFYSIPGPYTILAACGHSVAGTGENKQQCNKKLPSSHHFGGSPCIREALCPQLWIGDLARLLAVCWGKIHPIESNPQNTVLATDALNKTTLIRNTFLQVGTGPLFFSGQQLPYLWIIQINESFSGQVLVLKTCKKIRRIIFVTKNSAWHHPPKKKKTSKPKRLEFQGAPSEGLCFRSRHSYPRGHGESYLKRFYGHLSPGGKTTRF